MITSRPEYYPNVVDDAIIENKKYFNEYFTTTNPTLEPAINPTIATRFNTRAQIFIHCINVDSSKRQISDQNIYDNRIINLPPYPLKFTNASPLVMVNLPNHNFREGDRMTFNNIVSKIVMLQNVIMVKKNSMFVRTNHKAHGLSFYGLYNPANPQEFTKIEYVDLLPVNFKPYDNIVDVNQHYILKINNKINLTVDFSNIKIINNDRSVSLSDRSIGNIPLSYLNRKHTIYLFFTKIGNQFVHNPDSYLIRLKKRSSINYRDTKNNTTVCRFNNLFGIPLDLINNKDVLVVSVNKNTFVVDFNYPAIVDPNINFYTETDIVDQDVNAAQIVNANVGGGTQGYLRRVTSINPGFPNPNTYTYQLDRVYKNVVRAQITSSIFPNSQRIINSDNNKLYWKNLNDDDFVYQLAVDPGNYSPNQLARTLEKKFRSVIKYQYINSPQSRYDVNGIYKYHIVDVDINPITDIVIFTSWGKIALHDTDTIKVLSVPDPVINLDINHDVINNVNLQSEILFYYRKTTLTDLYVSSPQIGTSMLLKLETTRVIIMNFRYNNSQIVHTINSTTIINSRTKYNYLTQQVDSINHCLSIGDLIVTDKFHDPKFPNTIGIYEVTNIIDPDKLTISRILAGSKFKFIYENLAINFTPNAILQIERQQIIIKPYSPNTIPTTLLATTPVSSLTSASLSTTPNLLPTTPSLIIAPIAQLSVGNNILRIYHPNHQLNAGDQIVIANSLPINNIPANVINTRHTIDKIIDDNQYSTILPDYLYDPNSESQNIVPNRITIKYPTMIQFLFNRPNTLGSILNFPLTGQNIAVTEYNHIVKNTDPYEDGIERSIQKLSMSGDNYFYLCCPELANIRNTQPVENVFAIIRWTANPGDIAIDSFAPNVKTFNYPLTSLNELHISCYHPDGRLVDFNGIDHEFTIELTELYPQPDNIDVYARTNSVVLTNEVDQ